MATKLGDITVDGSGNWSSGPHTLASGAHSVTMRRKSDGAVLVTRGFTVAASSSPAYRGVKSAMIYSLGAASFSIQASSSWAGSVAPETGDLLVVALWGGAPTGVPSGFTEIAGDAGTGMYVGYRIRQAGDADGTTFAIPTYDDGEGGQYTTWQHCIAFRGINASAIDVKAPATGFTAFTSVATVTGAALSPASTSMVVMLTMKGPVSTVSGVGGSATDYQTASLGAPHNMQATWAYDATATGKTTAPTQTFSDTGTGSIITFALRAA